ncbi:MAG: HPP family protein [Ferroplasma sp.]|uniref:HPP family protein n=1 Tax=Ferroplasma sp. TaxID=2591003 RepID=UPI0028158BFB|nr:HPP family protein [Ferroplasma sp.]WMT51495.1 MAG: HPP family protein [Ferroplasma sp.]
MKYVHSNNEIRIRNSIIPAIFIGITMSITIFSLSLIHIYVIPIAKFIVFSSFASSSFLLFMEPHQESSRISKFVKSYIISGICGIIGFVVSLHIGLYSTLALVETMVALLLVAFKAMHPPAMGIAVVFILERANVFALLFLFAGMLLIIIFDRFLNKFVYIIEDEFKIDTQK